MNKKIFIPIIAIISFALIACYESKTEDITLDNALYELFGSNGGKRILKTASNEKTSLLVKLPFNYRNKKHLVFITKTQEIDPADGQIKDCHICQVKLSAVVFNKVGDSWEFVSKSKYFTEFGQWGDAKIIDKIQIYENFATNTVGFFVGDGDMHQGYATEGKTIIIYSNGHWLDLGFVKTVENNEGACNENKEARLEGGFLQCWSYESSIKLEKNIPAYYPNIIVNRSGTMLDKDHKVIKAQSVTYRYVTDGYKSDEGEDE